MSPSPGVSLSTDDACKFGSAAHEAGRRPFEGARAPLTERPGSGRGEEVASGSGGTIGVSGQPVRSCVRDGHSAFKWG